MIVGLLLAAGAGTRFGGDKLLAELDGQPLAAHALATLGAATDTVLAVVRPGDAALRALLTGRGARVVECADAHLGMGHSLACAARQALPGAHVIVALADMPRVSACTVQAVADALRGGARIAVPTHAGQRGHPVGFAASVRPQLETLRGDTGARGLLAAHSAQVTLVPVQDPGCVLDVDTPAALAGLGG